jgi:hypothetical protein
VVGHFGGSVLVGLVLSLLSEVCWKYVDGEVEGVLIYMQPRMHVFYILNLHLDRNIASQVSLSRVTSSRNVCEFSGPIHSPLDISGSSNWCLIFIYM